MDFRSHGSPVAIFAQMEDVSCVEVGVVRAIGLSDKRSKINDQYHVSAVSSLTTLSNAK